VQFDAGHYEVLHIFLFYWHMHVAQTAAVSTHMRAISVNQSRSAQMFIIQKRASDRLRRLVAITYPRVCRSRFVVAAQAPSTVYAGL